MKAAIKTTTPLTAKEELAQLRARLFNKVEVKNSTGLTPTTLIGEGIDRIDRTREFLINGVAGDDNVFTKINVARIKAKAARGGYAS